MIVLFCVIRTDHTDTTDTGKQIAKPEIQTETTSERSYTFKTGTSDSQTSSVSGSGTDIHSVSSPSITEAFTESSKNIVDQTIPETVDVHSDQYHKKLSDFLILSGFQADDSKQIITVESSGSACHVCFFDCTDEVWDMKCEAAGIVGKNGVSDKSMEGDYRTPSGKFSLGFAFGTENLDGLSVEYRIINNNCYWVDDPESPLYNHWVETENITWNSAEHMSDYPECYKYGVVINYNMDPVEKYKGSAIFLHCMSGEYTAGCVGVPEDTMLFILKNLDPAKDPCIMIV